MGTIHGRPRSGLSRGIPVASLLSSRRLLQSGSTLASTHSVAASPLPSASHDSPCRRVGGPLAPLPLISQGGQGDRVPS